MTDLAAEQRENSRTEPAELTGRELALERKRLDWWSARSLDTCVDVGGQHGVRVLDTDDIRKSIDEAMAEAAELSKATQQCSICGHPVGDGGRCAEHPTARLIRLVRK